jgi:hypothetical protein
MLNRARVAGGGLLQRSAAASQRALLQRPLLQQRQQMQANLRTWTAPRASTARGLSTAAAGGGGSGSRASAASAAPARSWWSSGLLAAGGAVAMLLSMNADDESAAGRLFGLRRLMHACGIVAFVGTDEPATPYLLEGLQILQNRGYDSAGVATLNSKSHELVTTKFASVGSTSDCIDLLTSNAPARHNSDTLGIAHTRWATHGGKTDANAHPHLDSKERVALVHNGTIENSGQLKAELQKVGIKFKSQTDTEVIAQLIGFYLDQKMNIHDAVQKSGDSIGKCNDSTSCGLGSCCSCQIVIFSLIIHFSVCSASFSPCRPSGPCLVWKARGVSPSSTRIPPAK